MASLTSFEAGGLFSTGQRVGWQQLSGRYPNDRDCLACFLALELAEVLQGAKPANLICISNKSRPCGRNPYFLWKEHGADLLSESGLRVRLLADRGDSLLLLPYSLDALNSLLREKSVRVILSKAGYRRLDDPDAVLTELAARVTGEGFPHEIGVFLGYPLKDVVGFMGWAALPFTCQGPWKIFGNPADSLRLAEAHRNCRWLMAQQLASGRSPQECLTAGVRSAKRSAPAQQGRFCVK